MSARLAQAIGMLSLGAGELDALVADHVERNPFLVSARRPAHADVSALEATVADRPSLHAHIASQAGLAFPDPRERALALALADELDEAGYLRASPDDLAARLGVPPITLARVFERCRLFEPTGLFARDLPDCLALQLEATGRLDAPMRALIAHLPLLASGDRVGLVAVTGLDAAGLERRLASLRSCDAKPGAGWSDGPGAVPSVLPVARIVRRQDGEWTVRLLASANPRVRVDAAEAARMRGGVAGDTAAAEFVRHALGEARWLERALAQRARSVALVVGEIARRQSDYLRRGERALRPMSMRAVGESVALHESTVSRVCAGKSVETPHGTVPLRSLFGEGVGTDDGALAARAVQRRIRDLVAAERPGAVLSDDALARALREGGVDIARRTVAKYREALAIAPSPVRRRALAGQATVARSGRKMDMTSMS